MIYVLLTIAAVAVLYIWKAVVIVRQGYKFTVERFGRYTVTLEPGIHIIVPFLDQIGHRINVMENVVDIPRQSVITSDNATVGVDGVLYFQVTNASKAAYEVHGLLEAVVNLSLTNLRTVMGSMSLDDLLSKRDEINSRLLTVIDDATTPWGVKVTRIEVKDIEPPQDLVNSMNGQMKAERDKRAQVLEAQGHRESEILRAEGEKTAAILQAEGRLEAADRDAQARERLAEAEAKATALVSDSIKDGDVQAINYFLGLKYVEALKDMASADNHKVIMMPLEASNMIGAIGGISELLSSVKGLK